MCPPGFLRLSIWYPFLIWAFCTKRWVNFYTKMSTFLKMFLSFEAYYFCVSGIDYNHFGSESLYQKVQIKKWISDSWWAIPKTQEDTLFTKIKFLKKNPSMYDTSTGRSCLWSVDLGGFCPSFPYFLDWQEIFAIFQ